MPGNTTTTGQEQSTIGQQESGRRETRQQKPTPQIAVANPDIPVVTGDSQPDTMEDLVEELDIVMDIESPQEAARKIKERVDRHGPIREDLLGDVQFRRKERRILSPRIISGKSPSKSQIALLVPEQYEYFDPVASARVATDRKYAITDPEEIPKPKPVEWRRNYAWECIGDLQKFLQREAITSSIPRDLQREWRTQKAMQSDFFERVYETNQLRGNQLGALGGSVETLGRLIGNAELNRLAQTTGIDYQQQFREWGQIIRLAVGGEKGEYHWMEATDEQKLQLVQEIEDVVIGVLNILSSGMEGKQKVMRIT